MKCSLHCDRRGERDIISILSISRCGQRGGDNVAQTIANQNKEVVGWST